LDQQAYRIKMSLCKNVALMPADEAFDKIAAASTPGARRSAARRAPNLVAPFRTG
jgi:hypothetical protein